MRTCTCSHRAGCRSTCSGTRLAGEFAARSAAEGWQVVSAVQGTEADWARSRSEDLSARDGVGVLLIVDYADRWSRTTATWLLANSLLARPGSKVRVLMLARTADGLSALSEALRENQAAPSVQFLDELPARSEQRAAMFSAARDGFAACFGISEAGGIEPPVPLDHADMGLTLAVHMAALTVVDARANGVRPPASLTGLTIYLLDRERLHWERLAGDAAYELNQDERPISTSPEMMARVVFAAALTGAQSRELGQMALRLAGLGQDPDAERDPAAHDYPLADAAGVERMLGNLSVMLRGVGRWPS